LINNEKQVYIKNKLAFLYSFLIEVIKKLNISLQIRKDYYIIKRKFIQKNGDNKS
jgi:hypothetical protein